MQASVWSIFDHEVTFMDFLRSFCFVDGFDCYCNLLSADGKKLSLELFKSHAISKCSLFCQQQIKNNFIYVCSRQQLRNKASKNERIN